MAKKISISAFFPAYNEEANVGNLALKTAQVLSKITSRYEVIIVNDCSKDRTAAVGASLHRKNPRIRIINHKVNRGYGGAVKTGLYGARMDYIFFTDGDSQFDVSEIPLLIEQLKDADIAVGYRIDRQDPWIRKVNAFCWGTLVNLLFRLGIRDVDCAFKLIPRKAIRTIDKLQSEGAMISTELLARSKKAGFSISEVGVHHYPRTAGTQTGAKLRVILRAFKELFKLYWKLK